MSTACRCHVKTTREFSGNLQNIRRKWDKFIFSCLGLIFVATHNYAHPVLVSRHRELWVVLLCCWSGFYTIAERMYCNGCAQRVAQDQAGGADVTTVYRWAHVRLFFMVTAMQQFYYADKHVCRYFIRVNKLAKLLLCVSDRWLLLSDTGVRYWLSFITWLLHNEVWPLKGCMYLDLLCLNSVLFGTLNCSSVWHHD